jgi:integrase
MLRYLIAPDEKHPCYRGRYRAGHDPRIREVTFRNVTVKEVADKLLRQLHEDAQREAENLIPAKSTRQAMQKPIMELFAEFMADKRKRGRSEDYVRQVEHRFPTLVQECEWNTLRDVSAKSFHDWRNTQTRYTPRTLNHYLAAAWVFLNWVERAYEIPNALKRVDKYEVKPKYPEGPRAFSNDELIRLLAVAKKWKLLYLLLALSGLRIKEARQLRWADVQFDGKPQLKLRPEATKSKRPDVIPLFPVLANALKAHRPLHAKPSDPVFRKGIAEVATLRRDAVKAGIELVDECNRPIGFHTFRRTFISLLHASGVAPRTVMQLARHRSLDLTNWVYTDTTKLGTDLAIEKLGGLLFDGNGHPRSAPLFFGHNGPMSSKSVQVKKYQNQTAPSEALENNEFRATFSNLVQDCQNGEGSPGRDSNPHGRLGQSILSR